MGGVTPSPRPARVASHRMSVASGVGGVTGLGARRRMVADRAVTGLGAHRRMVAGLAVTDVRMRRPGVARLHGVGGVAATGGPGRSGVAGVAGGSRRRMAGGLAHLFGDAAILPGVLTGAVFRRRRADLGRGGDRDDAKQGCDKQTTDHDAPRDFGIAEPHASANLSVAGRRRGVQPKIGGLRQPDAGGRSARGDAVQALARRREARWPRPR